MNGERRKLKESYSGETLQEALIQGEGIKYIVMYDEGLGGLRGINAQVCRTANEAEGYIRTHRDKEDGKCNWRYVIRNK